MIHTDFDPEKTAVIEPSEFYHPMENMPEALIGVFSRPLTEKYAAEFHGEVIMQYQDCNGGEPVYRCTAPNGTAFALMCMRVGAPSACGIMEEMIPHGVKKFLMLGSCGALDHAITAGHILVPYAAVRDEGTSYHYLPPSQCEACFLSTEHGAAEIEQTVAAFRGAFTAVGGQLSNLL